MNLSVKTLNEGCITRILTSGKSVRDGLYKKAVQINADGKYLLIYLLKCDNQIFKYLCISPELSLVKDQIKTVVPRV